MLGYKLMLLVFPAVAVAAAVENYSASSICSDLASIVNVIKQFTDLSLDIDFKGGNYIIHGPVTLQLTGDITTSCEGLKLDSRTTLFLAHIKDNVSITLRESSTSVLINDCELVAHITVTRDKAPEYSVTVKPRLIEMTAFKSVIINGTEMDQRFAEELIKPEVTKALSTSELGRGRIISYAGAQVNPFLPKQLVNEIYQYYFYRFTL